MDDIQEVDDNDSDDEDDNSQEYEEHRSDWMLLSEMMSNRQTRNLAPVTTIEMFATIHNNATEFGGINCRPSPAPTSKH